MNEREEGMILGELKEFKTSAMARLNTIEAKVDSLDRFKVKVTVIMAVILGVIEISFRAIDAIGKK